jgi:hypothetical protein
VSTETDRGGDVTGLDGRVPSHHPCERD